MCNVLGYDRDEGEFEFKSLCVIYFHTKTLVKYMNFFIPPSYDLNILIAVLLQ